MNEKPREKLALLGPKALENHELFEIILSKGTKKENVFELVQRLFQGFDQDELLQFKEVDAFQKNFQVGFVQACQLMATFELGKRLFTKNLPRVALRTSEEVYQFVKEMKNLKKEYARGLYVNTRYVLIHDEIIAIGSLDANIIHPREIFRPALEYGAYGVILIHNHPSGDPTPSQADIEVTQNLIKVGNVLQIPFLDHLVIGEKDYVSLNKSSGLN